MKGGTTWLMWHLRNSEAVFFAPEKEIHYHYSRAFWPDGTSWRMRMLQLAAKLTGRSALSYSTAISPRYRAQVTARYAQRFAQHASSDAEALVGEVDQFRANLRWYRDYMAEPVDSRWYERLFGGAGNKWPCDFSATTCMIGPRGWKLLKRSAEDVRVIYFIRDPYERLWSHAKWHAMGRGEWSDFKEMTPAKRAAFMRRYRLDQHSLYAKRIKQMRATLGNDNVLVLNFDDIAAAPEELLRMSPISCRSRRSRSSRTCDSAMPLRRSCPSTGKR